MKDMSGDEEKKPMDKKKLTFKERHTEGCWDSVFRRLCEVNYGCCCCLSLRAGTVVIAYFFIFWFMLQVAGGLLIASAYWKWLPLDFLIAKNDTITWFHKVDPFIYMTFASLKFCLSLVLLIGVVRESNMKLNFVRVFVQSFLILIALGVVYEATKFVVYVSIGEKNEIRIYGSLLGFVFLEGIYGWATIVVKCYYVSVNTF